MRLFPGPPARCAIGRAGPIRAARAAFARAAILVATVGFAVAMALPGLTVSAQAEEVGVRGQQDEGFGRIQLQFSEPVRVEARSANGVLVITFDDSLAIRGERLAQQMPSYVSVVRHDPDGTGMRMALTQNFNVNVIHAGELVFVDILPERWSGMLPGLPPEVVADLARRARAAEQLIEEERERRTETPVRPLPVRVAELPTLTRLVFEPPIPTAISRRVEEDVFELRFGDPFRLEAERPLAGIPGIAAHEEIEEDGNLKVRLILENGFDARGFHEEGSYVIDIEPLNGEAGAAAADTLPFIEPPADEAAPERARIADPGDDASPSPMADALVGPAQTAEITPTRSLIDISDLIREQTIPRETDESAEARGRFLAGDDAEKALRLDVEFGEAVPAAAFVHGGILRVVFDTQTPLALDPQPEASRAVARLDGVLREGRFVTIRFALPEPRIAHLTPNDDGWVLTIDGDPDRPAKPVAVRPDIDDGGRHIVAIDLPETSAVHWIDAPETGMRIAVATASGAPRNLPRAQRFVEFQLLQTVQGVAVAALADDLRVRRRDDGVVVSRPRDLLISGASVAAGETDPGEVPEVAVFEAGPWRDAQGGSVRRRLHETMEAVLDARPSQRADARLDVARFMLANGLAAEAAGVLEVVADDEPERRMDRRWLMLNAAAAMEMGRLDEAREILTHPEHDSDREILLWRAWLDAREGRAQQAIAGFRHGRPLLEAYPDDLQGAMRLDLAEAALDEGEIELARREATALGQLASGSVPHDALELLEGRIDLAIGQPEQALERLTRIAQEGARPQAARAELLRLEHGLARGSVSTDEAVEALERLVVSWRGDDVEIRTLGLLGRLYAEEGRWRDAFIAARNANTFFPDHPVSRELHEETARIFDEIFLGGRDTELDQIEAVALFFDFRDFLPIGRRGDEIVRHLSDRLVELDLIDKATELLRHQVDNRLNGSARATVAARLATLYLMEGEPLAAREVLAETRLPELPESIRQARILLEARALSDLSRTDLALEILAEAEGPEVDRLRADILWTARRWREAGEAHEAMTGQRWQDGDELTRRERTDVLRAAIAYTLAGEEIALDRLRAKYLDQMGDSEDAQAFATASSPDALDSESFRTLATRVTSSDTLFDFLDEYRKRFPETALPARPRGGAPGAASASEARPASEDEQARLDERNPFGERG
ncbi:MAG: hypothetical protein JJU21_10975 [Salinarimonas sp.]|nr:hypothetical protein [Salinarimonas sp.]